MDETLHPPFPVPRLADHRLGFGRGVVLAFDRARDGERQFGAVRHAVERGRPCDGDERIARRADGSGNLRAVRIDELHGDVIDLCAEVCAGESLLRDGLHLEAESQLCGREGTCRPWLCERQKADGGLLLSSHKG